MKIALAADWLVTYGGAEHVLAEFHALYPEAPIFTTVARPKRLGPLQNADIRTSYLQRVDRVMQRHQFLLPWMPRAIESLDVRDMDIILSSSHAVGKGIIPDGRSTHVCYCHTPMRYAWEMQEQYLDDFRVPHMMRRFVRAELARLRRWDLSTAKRVDVFLANSHTVAERIARIYGRTAQVIPPPADDRFFQVPLRSDAPKQSERYYLAVGRLVPYKRFDLLIKAANKAQLPLWIAGKGQDEDRLRAMAGPTVRFLGFVPDAELPALYAQADAFFFPQIEDAGIAILEAHACGTPAVALGIGGARDVVQEGSTGILFAAQEVDALLSALEQFHAQSWNRAHIRHHAEQFSQKRFRSDIAEVIDDIANRRQSGLPVRK